MEINLIRKSLPFLEDSVIAARQESCDYIEKTLLEAYGLSNIFQREQEIKSNND